MGRILKFGCGGLIGLVVLLMVIGALASKPSASPTASGVQSATRPSPEASKTAAPAATKEPSPAPMTPTPPTPTMKVTFDGRFDPKVLRIGEKLVVVLGLENKGDKTLKGFRVFSSGPWDKYTIANVMPGGDFDTGLLFTIFTTGMEIGPGEKRYLNIIAYPNEAGNHKFTFEARMPEYGALADENGEQPIIGGSVAVTK